jgi:uncharacterized protein
MLQQNASIKGVIAAAIVISFFFSACSSPEKDSSGTDVVEANIKQYTHVWDEIINKGKLQLFNDSNFTKDVVMHGNPDVVGIDSARAMYANYITGFSNKQFTIVDVFGQGNKLVKHWKFKGKHTGMFFGIPATGKEVSLEGATIVRMQDGKIAEEQDFFNNLELMTQLGLHPPSN